MTTSTDKTTTTSTWALDPAASRVEFRVAMRKLFLANVTVVGRFSEVHGTLTGTPGDPTNVQVLVTIGAASLTTNSAPRDKHLRSADFFDVTHYPSLTFTSQRIEALDPTRGHFRVTGSLTIRDVTRDISLDARYTSSEAAGQRQCVNLETTLDRRDFGLVWSRPMNQIADNVKITLHTEWVPGSSPA